MNTYLGSLFPLRLRLVTFDFCFCYVNKNADPSRRGDLVVSCRRKFGGFFFALILMLINADGSGMCKRTVINIYSRTEHCRAVGWGITEREHALFWSTGLLCLEASQVSCNTESTAQDFPPNTAHYIGTNNGEGRKRARRL